MRRVYVTGLGVLSAFGASPSAFAEALVQGRSAITRVSSFAVDDCRSTLAAEIPDFVPTAWVPAMKLRRLDRTGVYALAVAQLVLADARLTFAPEGHDDVGVVLGTWTAGGQSTQIFVDALLRQGPGGAPAILFDSTVGNSAASLVGLEYKLRGPNLTISHKEASGLAAIVTAVDHLREGRARALLASGVDAVFETFYKGHDRFGVMSRATRASAATAPFATTRSGWVLGEGAFGLWLTADPPAADGPRWGEVLGVSASSAVTALNQWPATHTPIARTMRLALEDAGLTPGDVHVVYASANAAPGLDAVEAAALDELFGGSSTVITSIKGAVGESGAASAAACVAALICGREGVVPPVAGLTQPDPVTARLRVARDRQAAPGPIVLVNSVASGGALFSAVLRIGA